MRRNLASAFFAFFASFAFFALSPPTGSISMPPG